MGYSLYLHHRSSEAAMSLNQALALQPNDARAHINLGLVSARSGKANEALGEFYKAGCDNADARVNLAFAPTFSSGRPRLLLVPERQQHGWRRPNGQYLRFQ